MYGLLLRSIQAYLRATFGAVVWARVLRLSGQPVDGFEPMLPYDAQVLDSVLAAAAAELNRPVEAILEDVGTFLVANPDHQSLRRLLRFGGATFAEFLQSLEELPDRARLALPDLELPQITLHETGPGFFRLTFGSSFAAFYPVALGALRATADDYGALVLIDTEPSCNEGLSGAVLSVNLLEPEHGLGQRFELSLMGRANEGSGQDVGRDRDGL
ncbi:MAG: heme NO-binding domain-containing protein [Paracoccaceae bacterium]